MYALTGLAFCLIVMIGTDLTGRLSLPVREVYFVLTGVVLFVPSPASRLSR
jgi:hypothetical protein